jgi:ParB-like chromosome segregation protein Spo0J
MTQNHPGAVSLKVMAERKIEGVQTTKQFKVPPSILEFEDGFNCRPISREHVESLKQSFKAGVVWQPIVVRVADGHVFVVGGHHRTVALREMLAEGLEIESIDVTQFRGSDADRIIHMLTSAQGLPVTPLQSGVQYRKLIAFGWDIKKICQHVGKTPAHVGEMIRLAESNSDVQRMVESNEVAAHTAVKAIRAHGQKAGAVLADELVKAKASGKTKVTAKTIRGDRLTLEKAIQREIDSDGTIRAETLCQEYKELISYLRSHP